MYKTDIRDALHGLVSIPASSARKLAKETSNVATDLWNAAIAIASGNDQFAQSGRTMMEKIIAQIHHAVSDKSPSEVIVDLHLLRERFAQVIVSYPEIAPLLESGVDAVGQFSNTFDRVLRGNKSRESLVGAVAPAVKFDSWFDHCGALLKILPERQHASEDEGAEIEVDGIQNIEAFSSFVRLLAYLAQIAESLVAEAAGEQPVPSGSTSVIGIESGSPIKITLGGNSKALTLLLTMLRDVVRVPYLHLTKSGRAIQAMEIFAKAKALGISSAPVLDQLEGAMIEASRSYAGSFEQAPPKVVINGAAVRESETLLLFAPESVAEKAQASPEKLPAPGSSDSAE